MVQHVYDGFARHYDLHGWDWFAAMHGDRLAGLLEERGLAGRRVLDAGCGTGTLALALAEGGFRVTGLDLSEGLLARARAKDQKESVRWVRGDIRDFDLGPGEAPLDAIVCVADTMNHLESLDGWEAAFRRFASHLGPGGLLFVDAVTIRGLERMDRQSVAQVDEQALIVAVVYEPAARRSTLRVTSFRRAEGSRLYERAADTITEWGQPVASVVDALARSGFDRIERPWSASADPEADERLDLLAIRV